MEKRIKVINRNITDKARKAALKHMKDLNLTLKSNANKNSTEIPFFIYHT